MDNMLKHIIESQVGKTVILASPTGSRLYGINRPDSGYDFWVVVSEGKKPWQTIVDGVDTTVVPLHTFTLHVLAVNENICDVDIYGDLGSGFYCESVSLTVKRR